jgi:tetratricopeptide (TPR) repeat protein
MIKIAVITICTLTISCNANRKDSSVTENRNSHIYERPKIKDSTAQDYYGKGLNAIKKEKAADAENFFHKADTVENNNPIIITALGNMAYVLGDSLKGESLYLRAISIDSIFSLSYLNYAEHLKKGHQLEKANSILLKAIQFNPYDYDKGRIYHDLALLSIEMNNCDSAKEYSKRARLFSPDQYGSFVREVESVCKK